MRKILSFGMLIALLSSCISLEQVTVTDVVDYSAFAKKGIFVTESNNVNFDYKPLGSVVSVSRGAAKTFSFFLINIDRDKAFSEITEILTALKADGLINLKISITHDKVCYYMTVTGMAIRRNAIVEESNIIEESNDMLADGADDVISERVGDISDIKYTIFRETKTGVCISTERKLTVGEMKKIKEKLPVKKTLIQFYLVKQTNDKPYAGFSDNVFVDYVTGKMIEFYD